MGMLTRHAQSVAHFGPMPTTLPDDELHAWIRLTLEPGVGPVQARHLLASIGLPQDIFAQSTGQLLKILPQAMAIQLAQPPSAEIQAQINKTLAWLDHPSHYVVTLADPAYPASLLETHDPPPVLYVNGNPGLLHRPSMAIVGARSATPGGEENARAFAQYLAQAGWCVLSGLASGIDAAAHKGALAAGPQGGQTIAVLGTGIDIVYPARNRNLAHEIAEQGALVTEFSLGSKAMPHQFPRRNRIVAGLSRGVLVVEAALQSGSLITARQASEIGREVFAIPGSIHSPLSRGCHALIRQGAKLVESGQDIIEELKVNLSAMSFPATRTDNTKGKANKASGKTSQHTSKKTDSSDTQSLGPDREQQAPVIAGHATLLSAIGYDPIDIDTLMARTRLDIVQLSRQLAELELDGLIARLPDSRLQRQAK